MNYYNMDKQKEYLELIKQNKKLVYSIANKINKVYPEIDNRDLTQAGFIGLIKAYNKYNPNRNSKPTTYYYQVVKRFIIHEVNRQKQIIYIPRYIMDNINHLYKAQSIYNNTKDIYKYFRKVVGLNKLISRTLIEYKYRSEPIKLEERVLNTINKVEFNTDNLLDKQHNLDKIISILPKLKQREQYIIYNRFFKDKPMTFLELGKRLNILPSYVGQLQKYAIKKIRKRLIKT